MFYGALAISIATVIIAVVLGAQRRLGRGILAFALIEIFAVSTGFAIGEFSSRGSGWFMALGAMLIGPLGFLRYYYRDKNQSM